MSDENTEKAVEQIFRVIQSRVSLYQDECMLEEDKFDKPIRLCTDAKEVLNIHLGEGIEVLADYFNGVIETEEFKPLDKIYTKLTTDIVYKGVTVKLFQLVCSPNEDKNLGEIK